MPTVEINAKTEIASCKSVISQLADYQSKNWAIGVTGDTLQPDGFLAFFNDRSLAFAYYLRSQGMSVGDSSAYKANTDTLNAYMTNVRAAEEKAVEATIALLNDYKGKNWAIGFNGDTLQPDGFLPFFARRGLPFASYVRKGGVSIGDASAYDKNIATLRNHLASLG